MGYRFEFGVVTTYGVFTFGVVTTYGGRLIKVVQHALSISKGFKSVITIPNIACGRNDFLKLIALAKGSVVKEFDKNIITYNSVHTSNGGCNQVSGLKTILKAILSCPSTLDKFLGYR